LNDTYIYKMLLLFIHYFKDPMPYQEGTCVEML